MIRQSIAYAENRAEKIYIYSDLEEALLWQDLRSALMENSIQTMIGTELYARKEPSSLTKEEKRDISLTILCYSYAVRELCVQYKRAVPTVIKLIYDAKTRQVRAQYGYERLKSLSEYDDNARCRMWFDEIRAKNL